MSQDSQEKIAILQASEKMSKGFFQMEKGKGNVSTGVTNHKFLASFLAAYQLCLKFCLKLLVLGTNGQKREIVGFILYIKDSLMQAPNRT